MQDYEFIDGWRLRETVWKPEEESSKATVFALANGYMGSRGAFEEADPTEPGIVGNYINGIYDTPLGKLTEREIVNIPDWHHITLDVDGERFDMRTGEVLDYWRELDMREGILRRHVRWKSPAGKVVTIDTERFLSMARQNMAALRYTITADSQAEIAWTASIEGSVNNRWADHLAKWEAEADAYGFLTATAFTSDPGHWIVTNVATLVTSEGIQGRQTFRTSSESEAVRKASSLPLDRGESVTFDVFMAAQSGRRNEIRQVAVLNRLAQFPKKLGYDALKAEHIARWAEIWENSDVVITGDEDAQLGIRFSLFHLLAAAPWWSDKVSIPARGLQGQDYYGSIFWDCEIFVFPMLCATQPEVARNCLGYRWHTLNGARRKANNYGFDGAFYAWQSQETGDDQCALYVFTNPFTGRPMRAPFSDQQIHISADIVYALWQYYSVTGDNAFMREKGLEIAFEVARFFATRAEKDTDGSYHLRGVLGPDEYHECVDDDAYTNVIAKFALDVALKLWDRFGAPDALMAHIRLTPEEVARWREVRDGLYIPQENADGIIEQFAGYFDLEDAPVDVVRGRLAHPDLHPGGPLGPFQSTQIIKQADVVMMLYLFRQQYSEAVKRANWEYYESRTAHDSSLSPMAYSLVAADVGMTEWAYKYFIHTSHIDLASFGPHWNLGIHAAGLGGAWLALIHGFCQFEQTEDGLWLRNWPRLPEQWNEVRFRAIQWGHTVEVTATHTGVTLRSLDGAGQPIPVRSPRGEAVLGAGGELVLKSA